MKKNIIKNKIYIYLQDNLTFFAIILCYNQFRRFLLKEDIKKLKKEFKRIKSIGLIKTFREGPTGVGYTFETLLNKKEDQKCKPDYGCVELKCRLGYSKSSITLFNCVPKRNGDSALKYIFQKYSHHRYGNVNDIKLFERKIFSNYSIKRFDYEFKLKVDYYRLKIVLKSYYKNIFLEEVCYWDFKTLETKLQKKLTYLSVIKAYPYRKQENTFYKYVSMDVYKLRGFFEFLQLIENDKIFVSIYLKSALEDGTEHNFRDHGVAFRIKPDCLEELFWKI